MENGTKSGIPIRDRWGRGPKRATMNFGSREGGGEGNVRGIVGRTNYLGESLGSREGRGGVLSPEGLYRVLSIGGTLPILTLWEVHLLARPVQEYARTKIHPYPDICSEPPLDSTFELKFFPT